MSDLGTEAALRALAAFPLEPSSVDRLGAGLINDTFSVESAAGNFVLQRVSPIFDPRIHDNIEAVTHHIEQAGLATPRLVKTRDGSLYTRVDADVWRVFTRVEGESFNRPGSSDMTRSAAELVGRFHNALAACSFHFVGLRQGVHDTEQHLARLRTALEDLRQHRLFESVRPLADEILQRAAHLDPLPDAAPIVGHGDLKLNNVMFRDGHRAHCLVDLDTVGPVLLAHELGDAWRSWCNPNGEDTKDGTFDLEIFEASWSGYQTGRGVPLDASTRRGLVLGVEWISLELAARFAADALNESYFGWDTRSYATRGEHNLVRAEGQLAFHRAAHACRSKREAILNRTRL